jgi:hypothetical protein
LQPAWSAAQAAILPVLESNGSQPLPTAMADAPHKRCTFFGAKQ